MGLRLIILKFLKVFDFIIHFVLSLDFPGPIPKKVDQHCFLTKILFLSPTFAGHHRPFPEAYDHENWPEFIKIQFSIRF